MFSNERRRSPQREGKDASEKIFLLRFHKTNNI